MKRNAMTCISLLLILCFLIAGCQTASTTTSSASITSISTTTQAKTVERTLLTIAAPANVLIEDYSTNAFTKVLEESLSVKLKVDVWSEPTTKLSLLVGSNAELPDIINFALDDTTIFKYGSSGIFLPLNKYYANKDLAKKFTALEKNKQDFILDNTRYADGNVYSMSLLGEYFPNNVPYNLLINKTWLNKLGKEIPKTTKEFYDVLKAFLENDMNGNGAKDEIPMLGCTNGAGSNVSAVLLNSFVNANPDKNYFYVESSKIQAAFISDDFRTGLSYIRSLVKDKLLDSASFTQTKDQFKAIVNQNMALVGVLNIIDHDNAFNKPTDAKTGYIAMYDHPIGSQYVYMKTPAGPNGKSYTIYKPTVPSQLYFITKSCKTPELAFQLGDLGYDPYNSKISRHGTEGKNWTRDPEVLKKYKAATIDGVTQPVEWVLLDDPWSRAQNEHWMQRFPGYFPFSFNLTRGQTIDAKTSKMEVVYDMFKNSVPDEYIGNLKYSTKEIDELYLIKTAIDDYVKESITAFATGNKDVDKDWDRYISELNNMGLKRYIQITQDAYDRTK